MSGVENNTDQTKESTFGTLDGVRTIAIFLVLMRHGIQHQPQNWQEGTLFNIFSNGWIGVDLFFVLSGFLIGHTTLCYISNTAMPTLLKIYFTKRALRILPLYIAGLILASFNVIPFYENSSNNISTDFVIHMLFIQDYKGGYLLTPLWSLATEVKFYIAAPFILFLLVRYRVGTITTILLILTVALLLIQMHFIEKADTHTYQAFFWTFRAPFHYAAYGILLGIFISLITYKSRKPISQSLNTLLFYISVMSIVFFLASQNWAPITTEDWRDNALVIFIFTLLSGILVITSTSITGIAKNILNNPFSRKISALSYALYISHMLVLPAAVESSKLIEKAFSNEIFWLCYLTYSFLLAISLHLFLEKPFLTIKNGIKPPTNKQLKNNSNKTQVP